MHQHCYWVHLAWTVYLPSHHGCHDDSYNIFLWDHLISSKIFLGIIIWKRWVSPEELCSWLLQSRGEAASALLQSRLQEESSPHLARVLQRPPTRSWLHCTRERSWEQNTQLQQRSPTHPGSVSSPETSHLPVHVKRKHAVLSNLSPVSIKTRIPSSPHPTPTDPTWCQCCITAIIATEAAPHIHILPLCSSVLCNDYK